MAMAKYNKHVVKKICDMIREDDYTQGELAKAAGISQELFSRWKKDHPEFLAAIERAKQARRDKLLTAAKRSLMAKITGSTATEVKETWITIKDPKTGKRVKRLKESIETTKSFQPDTTAIIFALTNLDPENWKNKQTNELTGKDGRDLFASMSDEELEKKIAELEAKSK